MGLLGHERATVKVIFLAILKGKARSRFLALLGMEER